MRWAVVAVALVASAVVLVAAEPVSATGSYEDTILGNSPVAYFRFGESSRGSAVENEVSVTRNGQPAQPRAEWSTSGVTYGTAHSGFGGDTAATFDGTGLALVDTWPFQKASASYELWIKPTSLPPTGTQVDLMSVNGCCLGHTVAGLRVGLTSTGTIVAEAGTDDFAAPAIVGVESVQTVGTGSWHQIGAVYDAGTKSIAVTVDGDPAVFSYPDFSNVSWNGLPANADNPLLMGEFVGAMDEVSIYDRALSLAEIRTDFLASGQSAPTGWNVPDDGSQILGPNASKTWDELHRCHCGDPIDTGSGNLHMPLASVSVPGRGQGLNVAMAYNSLAAKSPSSIGYGWSSTLDVRLIHDGFLDRKVVVQEGGATVPFNAGYGGWFAPPSFTAELHTATGGDWIFTRNHTEKFRFDSDGRLKSMSDQFGNPTTVTYPTSDPSAAGFRQASAITDSAGRSLTLAWYPTTATAGARGKLASITEPVMAGETAGRTAEFGYDTAGNLTSYKDVLGGTTVFTYDDAEFDPADHLMTKMRKPRQSDNNKVIENNFDAKGRVEWQEDELNRRTDFAYDTPSVGKTTVTLPAYNAAGDRHVRIDTYAGGVRTRTVTAAGTAAEQTTDFVFDADTGAPVTITDNAGKVTSFTSDGHGRLESVTDPTGRITRYLNDGPFDQVTSTSVGETTSSTAQIVTTTNEYHSTNGRLEKTTVAAGTSEAAVTDYVYGDTSHPEDVTKVIDPRAKEWLSGYDAGTGYLLWSENPEGERTVNTYNEIGWPKTVTSPKGVATTSVPGDYQTTYAYNLTERSTTVTGPEGDQTKTVLDANGNVASAATGVSLADVTSYSYTDADELAVVNPPGDGQKSYTYFANGAQKSYTNELGAVTSYVYDAGGNLLTETDPASRVTTNTYDAVGRLKTVRQPVSGATCSGSAKVGCISYFYDDAGRVTGVDYSDPDTPDLVNGTSYATGIVYDGLGRRVEAHAATGSGAANPASWDEAWVWNKRSQITSHTDRNATTVGYDWDGAGNLKTITYPGNKTLTRTFDDASRLKTTTDWSSRTATFDYDDDSNWAGTAFGSANTDVFGYDQAGRMTSATWKQGTTVLGAEAYTRPNDTKGMVDILTPSGAAGTAATDNGYDNRDRLTGTGAETFDLDAASNLIVGPGGNHQAFDLAQQLCWTSRSTAAETASPSSPGCPSAVGSAAVSQDATTYTSDELGRRKVELTEDEDRRTHSYDQASRLTRVLDDNTGTNDPATAMSDTPVVGDFDADGIDDVLAYRAGGTNDDPVWWGTSRETFGTSTDTYNVTGTYTPLGGDFNGDGYGDVVWWAPGTTSDEVWFWFGRYDGSHDTVTATIDTPSTYTPFTGDFDGDGYSDIYWFKSGSGTDWIWFGDDDANEDDHVYDQDNEDYSSQARPAAGDFDGDGSDEIFWYGPGANPDVLWDFSSRTSHTSTAKTIGSTVYVPSAGDFNGDGYDDLLVNNPTADGGDAVWWGPALVNTDGKALNLATNQVPVIGDFDGDGRDDLLANQLAAGGDTIWWGTETKAGFSASPDIGFALNPTTLDATYTYDTDGIRATKTVNGGTTQKFTYSSGAGLPMLLTQQSGSDTTYLVYGPGNQPIEQINPDGTAVWLHHDQLGSIRMSTAAGGSTPGAEVSRRRYDAYGTVAAKTGTQPLLSYAGQYTDSESGYQYLRARYLDQGSGQFLTVDPLLNSTQSAYAYGGLNPAAKVDPSGLIGIKIGPLKVGDGCPLGKNPNGSCRGSNLENVVNAANTASSYVAGAAGMCVAAGAVSIVGAPAAAVCASVGTVATGINVASGAYLTSTGHKSVEAFAVESTLNGIGLGAGGLINSGRSVQAGGGVVRLVGGALLRGAGGSALMMESVTSVGVTAGGCLG